MVLKVIINKYDVINKEEKKKNLFMNLLFLIIKHHFPLIKLYQFRNKV